MSASGAAPPNTTVQERLAAQLEAIITKRIANDQLVLPSIPAVAAKALLLTKDPDCSFKAAAALIDKDPTLAAQLLRLVNSAALSTREPQKSVLAAVTRIGVQKLRGFLLEVSARKAFESRDIRIAEAFRGLWEHSVAVAILARDVVTLSNSGDPDLGYLAGLLHDVGKPVVATLLLEAERATMGGGVTSTWISGGDWVGVIQRCHQRVGVALATKWELPDAVCRAIRDCSDYDNNDRLSIANAVRFANALAKQDGIYVGPVDADEVSALVMIGRSLLNLEEDAVARLLAPVKGAVKGRLT